MNPRPLENRGCEIGSTADNIFDQDDRRGRRFRVRRSNRRNGTVLVFVLVCLAVVSTILLGAVKVSIRNRQQTQTEIQLEQTYWLLDAGIGTAITKFRQSPDFVEYSFATEDILKNYTGSVDIQKIERNDNRVSLKVTAKLQGRHRLSSVTQRSSVIVLDNLEANQTESNTNQTDGVTIHERQD